MIIVVDASVVVPAAIAGRWSSALLQQDLRAPSLLWSEVSASLRQLEWLGDVSRDVVSDAFEWLPRAGITEASSSGLIGEARQLAAELGWAKTYDAEYVVLARSLGVALATIDLRLRRSVASLVSILDLS